MYAVMNIFVDAGQVADLSLCLNFLMYNMEIK